jgi:hypothetical protein
MDLTFATRLAASSESECQILNFTRPPYHGCLQIGTPPQLAKIEIENVHARMAGYGVGGDES